MSSEMKDKGRTIIDAIPDVLNAGMVSGKNHHYQDKLNFFLWVETKHSFFTFFWDEDPDGKRSGPHAWEVWFKVEKGQLLLNKASLLRSFGQMTQIDWNHFTENDSATTRIYEMVSLLSVIGHNFTDLFDVRAQRKKDGVCQECGHRGEWRMLALFCPLHGRFAG